MKYLKSIILIGTLLSVCLPMSAFDGKWTGNLNVQGTSLPLIINFHRPDSCTLESPMQNVKGLQVAINHVSSDSVALTCPTIGATYRGKVVNMEIVGTFSQSGFSFPLTLKPEEPISERRPQTPKPPFPYHAKDTVFHSTDGTLLAGTLTIPEGFENKKVPMVVMVTGSGPQNRDEEMFDHKPFAVIADYLARNGVATFRYDDRGTAQSAGSFKDATIETFKNDANAALEFARKFSNGGKTGILGHSEGGAIAFLLAEEDIPDFVISLAGMTISGKETIMEQNRHLLEISGLSADQIEASTNFINNVFDEIIEQSKAGEPSSIDVDAIASKENGNVPPMVIQLVKKNVADLTPYFEQLLMLDTRKDMKKIKCPVLAINGTRDTQVNCTANLEAIRRGIPQAKIHALEGLNHMLQHAQSGEVAEYINIRETISPEALQLITDFIQTTVTNHPSSY